MSEPNTETNPYPDAPTDPHPLRFTAENLKHQTATLLAPLFLALCGGDMLLARMTAIDAAAAYRVQNIADLISVSQIIAYGLAALRSLGQSMEDDISLSMALRLRGNANALDRSAERNRRFLRDTNGEKSRPRRAAERPPDPEPPPPPPEDRAEIEDRLFLDVAAAELLAAEAEARLHTPAEVTETLDSAPDAARIEIPTKPETAADKRHKEMWAIAMVKEAKEITDSLSGLTPTARQDATVRASVLSSTANQLLTGLPTGSPQWSAPMDPSPRERRQAHR